MLILKNFDKPQHFPFPPCPLHPHDATGVAPDARDGGEDPSGDDAMSSAQNKPRGCSPDTPIPRVTCCHISLPATAVKTQLARGILPSEAFVLRSAGSCRDVTVASLILPLHSSVGHPGSCSQLLHGGEGHALASLLAYLQVQTVTWETEEKKNKRGKQRTQRKGEEVQASVSYVRLWLCELMKRQCVWLRCEALLSDTMTSLRLLLSPRSHFSFLLGQ